MYSLPLFRYYVVNCINKKNDEKLNEFFQKFNEELINNPEWTRWFGIKFFNFISNYETKGECLH